MFPEPRVAIALALILLILVIIGGFVAHAIYNAPRRTYRRRMRRSDRYYSTHDAQTDRRLDGSV
ncbi:hypothetical protein DMC47_15715 [Nostoc sp. 3335mG]|nr:hypothetical protein DMC47_15715 [Nostoc sp. 3335mG]